MHGVLKKATAYPTPFLPFNEWIYAGNWQQC